MDQPISKCKTSDFAQIVPRVLNLWLKQFKYCSIPYTISLNFAYFFHIFMDLKCINLSTFSMYYLMGVYYFQITAYCILKPVTATLY